MHSSLKKLTSRLYTNQTKGFAVNIKALKNRIKSVSSIEKITKAMKMVSQFLRLKAFSLESNKFLGFRFENAS